ncbi:sensor histidine kinase [Roseateles sp. PN1]|uniref:sensor histidine kinase n=1 Tax=Roseateles sp. PN1 TaxID=3137372 RepID=UPI003138F033
MLLMSVLLVLATAIQGAITAQRQSNQALQDKREQAAMLAHSLAVATAELLRSDRGYIELQALIQSYASFDSVGALSILGLKGQVMAQLHRTPKATQVTESKSNGAGMVLPTQPLFSAKLADDGKHLEIWQPVMAGRHLGWVKLDYDLQSLREVQAQVWRETLAVAALLVVLCMMLLHALLKRPMRALENARRFASELADARGLTEPVEAGPIEFVELGRALNEASVLLLQQMIVLKDSMQRQQTHKAQMEAQNEQLSAIFALSRDGLLTFDQHGQVQFANRAFLDLTGLQAEELLGQTDTHLETLLLARAQDAEEFAGLAACFAPPDPLNAQKQARQTSLSLIGDRPRVLALSGQHSQSARVSRVLYVCDVTRQHEVDRMKSEFLALAAHELRTPMTSIFGYVELMLEREMSEAKRQSMLARIYRQCQLMINILNELLDLARIEARGASDFKFETLDLATVVAETLNDFKPPQGREPPQLEARDAGHPPMLVCIDRQKMQQILLGTLSNAYKYSPEGGLVTVRLLQAQRPASTGKRIANGIRLGNGGDASDAAVGPEGRPHFGVQVEDRGIGLSAESLARMGERFFRVDTSGHIPGTGLGVSIARELLDLMGGHMQIESELGRGTRVTLWIKC